MPSLCLITVPGLEVSSDWRLVHDRLLDEFPDVTDVLATTITETILVVSEHAGPGAHSRWLDTVSETLLKRRHSQSAQRYGAPRRRPLKRPRTPGRSSLGWRSLGSPA
jgi:hypothetical protein